MLGRTMFAPSSRPPPSGPASQAMRVTAIGRSVRVARGRAPSALHLMSLVRTETEAVITVVMRMHRPPRGAVTGWAITHQLPYDQLWAVDDLGARYTVRFEGGVSRTDTWRGIAQLTPVPRAAPGALTWSATKPASSKSPSGPRPRAVTRRCRR
jgi:hypothetical protein